jgi:hypothetical protein
MIRLAVAVSVAVAVAVAAALAASSRDLLREATWLVEHDPTSIAEIKSNGAAGSIAFHFALGAGAPRAQFAALVAPIAPGSLAAFSRVTFTARATRPMRINVDLRPAGANNPPRWRRSVYLDDTPRTVLVAFDDLRPIAGSGPVPLSSIGALMFVVDTNNTQPAASGDVTFTSVALDR